MSGECVGTFTTPKNQAVLTIWNHRAVVAGTNEIRLLDIDETPPVARK